MGGVVDGTPVDAATTNPAFLDANGDDTALGKISFNDQDPSAPTVSGAAVNNIQREKNSIESWMGKSPNLPYNSVPTFSNSEGFTAMQSYFARLEALSLKFFKTFLSGGHSHDGSDGGGAPVQSASVDGVRLHGYIAQAPLISSVTGSSTIVTTQFSGKTPSGGDTIKGVVVLAPNNKVVLRQGSGANYGDQFVDSFGNVVYGRLTQLAGVWTLSYFVDLSGVETAYSFSGSVSVLLYYQELFNPITDAPVYSEFASIPSDNVTSDAIDATATQRGLMSAGTQSLGGNKTWVGTQLFQAIATFAANVIMQARIFFSTVTDSTTTGSGATLPVPSKTAVRLTNASLVSIQEISGGADGAFFIAINNTGVDVNVLNETGTVGNQIRTPSGSTFKHKNKMSVIYYYEGTSGYWYIVGGGGSDLLIGNLGSSPNAAGLTYNSGTGTLNAEAATASFPGMMSIVTQTLAGAKTWTGNMIMQALIRFDTQTDSSTTGSNADLPAPAKGVLRLTNASLVSIQRVLTMGNEQVAVLMNKTGVSITLINNFGAEGFLTGTGADMLLQDGASVLLVKDSVSSRVMIVGGASGGSTGGGAYNVSTITAAGTTALTNNPLTPRRLILLDATLGNQVITMPALTAGQIGFEYKFKRVDSTTNTVTINPNGTDTVDETEYQTLAYQYSKTTWGAATATAWRIL